MLIFLSFLKLGLGILYEPEQVHLAWADEDNAMTVTWAAQYPSIGASVEYGLLKLFSKETSSYEYKSLGTYFLLIWS